MTRATRNSRTAFRRFRIVGWLSAALLAGVGVYLLGATVRSPVFTLLPAGRVAPSLFKDRGVIPPGPAMPPAGMALPTRIPGIGGTSSLAGAPQVRTLAVVDLNSATLDQVLTLPGMTSDYARKVIAGRPYRSLQDVERAGIPHEIVATISPPAMIRSVQGPSPPKTSGDR